MGYLNVRIKDIPIKNDNRKQIHHLPVKHHWYFLWNQFYAAVWKQTAVSN
jgi:hypothetical protein